MEREMKSAGDSATTAATVVPTGLGRTATPGVRDGSLTVASIVDAYMACYAGRDTTRHQRLGWWVARVGSVPLVDLSDDLIFSALEYLSGQRGRYFAGKDADGRPVLKAKRKPLAPATINRYQAALSAVLTWAQRRRITPKDWHNPCRHLELKPERNEIVRFLSDEERAALLRACKASKWSPLYALVLMGLTTGARRGELEALRWADVDLERFEATVHRSKNGDRKVLPLVPAVVEELARLKGKADALVFPSRRRPDVAFNFTPAWERALKAAAVRNFRFHDLRHSCASYLAQSGAPLLDIAEVLGHRQLSITKRYSHLTVKHKAELVGRVLGDIR
jgi:integrase